MTTKGKLAMEKGLGENDILGLEEEIDSAVDRLFVEKKGSTPETLIKKSPAKEPSYTMEKDFDIESAIHPHPAPPPFLKSIENMESQLLSLEWEITKEILGKTREEVLAMRGTLKEKPDITSVLNLMEKVLDYMMKNEEKIRPPLVKFLLDSKETIKLLMRKETGSEINIYKQLVYAGIQARYSCLGELRETKKVEQPPVNFIEEIRRIGIQTKMEKQIEEILNKMNLFSEKAEEILSKVDQRVSGLEQDIQKPSEPFVKAKPVAMNITVFKVEGKLFGVESDKVVKLYKVPIAFHDKYSNQQKIRLKDFEVRLIDLKKIFSIQKGDLKGEIKILTMKDNVEYKGLMIDQVIERLSTPSDIVGAPGEYLLGTIHWTYQERPVEVPILDLKKF
jgi:chemotaxis protein histidine kinase CheA